jgi:hypothetical protein
MNKLVEEGKLRVCSLEAIELSAGTAMLFGGNFGHGGYVVMCPDELNLALHWYVRTVEAHKLKKLDGSTNTLLRAPHP